MKRVSYYDFLVNWKVEVENRLELLNKELDTLDEQSNKDRDKETLQDRINHFEKMLDSIEVELENNASVDSMLE